MAKSTASSKESQGFTAEERAAMKERSQELKAEARQMISRALEHAVRKFLEEWDANTPIG